jgi:hypothetical protein
MSTECPFSLKTVNQSVVRVTAFLTVVLLLTGLFHTLQWVALLLCIDFFIRGFTNLPISPLRRAARALAKILRLKPKMVNAGPKIFAAKVGFIATAIITLLSFTGLTAAAQILAGILILMAGLETLLGICVGCHIYSLMQTIKKALRSKTD